MDYIAHFEQNVTIILLGAGQSSRFCSSDFPKKQWLRIGEIPLWQVVVEKFKSFGFTKIILAVSRDEVRYISNSYIQCEVVEGGETRTQSILNALKNVQTPLVLISDVARWNVQKSVIEEMFEVYAKDEGLQCIAPALNVSDTMILQTQFAQEALPREQILAIQTPQLSQAITLQKALLHGEFSDESSAILALGEKVKYIEGSPLMAKITYQKDLFLLKDLQTPSLRTYIGNGVDIHAFEEGKKMKLCGIEIDCLFGFKAHSDGDVALHSLIDAILGAIGAGDIGEWFPDNDMEFKNADSVVLLQRVLEFIKNIGFVVGNIDLTIIAQTPKITPYKQKMRQKLAELFKIPLVNVNIKATTAEKLGFIGREEGVCVTSSVGMYFFDWSKYLGGKVNV